ncbi:hypothetical protein IT575_00810 [bacterium]|nr:hypothetical protein [bacterium]
MALRGTDSLCLAVGLLLLPLIYGCSSGTSSSINADNAVANLASGFSVNGIASPPASDSRQSFSLESIQVAGDEHRIIQITATGSRTPDGLFFLLSFDNSRWHFLDAEASRPEAEIFYSIETEPGQLQCGLVPRGSSNAAQNSQNAISSGPVVQLRFAPGPSANLTGRETLAAPPPKNCYIAQLGRFYIDKAAGTMSVRYREPSGKIRGIVPGDYNMDKLVSIHDMGLIGQFWGWRTPDKAREVYQALPPEATDEEKEQIQATTLTEEYLRLDGDANGLISAGDLTLIGLHFGDRLEGFNIYGDPKFGNAVPETVDLPSVIEPMLELREASMTPYGDGLVEHFGTSVDSIDPDLLYFARAVISGREYSCSNLCYSPAMAYDPNYVLSFDSEQQVLSWYYSLWGDLDQDYVVNTFDLNPLGLYINQVVPFDRSSETWMIDAVRNGVVSALELNAIENSFYSRYEGVRVYATQNPAEVPDDPHAPPALAPLVEYAAQDESGFRSILEQSSRRRFEAELDLQSGVYVWVRQLIYDGLSGEHLESACSEVILIP